MKSDKNTTQEKTKFNSYVWAGQCIYNIVKREATQKRYKPNNVKNSRYGKAYTH